MAYPLEIRKVDQETIQQLKEESQTDCVNLIRVGPKGCILPEAFADIAPHIYNMPLRESDIFVITFPRSGTTLTQELVWMVDNDLDYVGSAATQLVERYTFLEFSMFYPQEENIHIKNKEDPSKLESVNFVFERGTEQLAKIPTTKTRYIKTHLPLALLPPNLLEKSRVVYISRDPRDAAVSFYHLNQTATAVSYKAPFKVFWEHFVKDLLIWTPYFAHVKEAWELRNHHNMLFMFYEDIIKDMPAAISRVAKFLGKSFGEDEIKRLCEHLHIDNFKKNKSVNDEIYQNVGVFNVKDKFIRKGKSGGWRDFFDEEMTAQADKWLEENLRDTDLRFPNEP